MQQAARSHFETAAIWEDYQWQSPQAHRAELSADWLPTSVHCVLDAGCGNGMVTRELRKRFASVATDLSYTALAQVPPPRCQADLSRLPFPEAAFDAVVATEVLEHIPESIYESALCEVLRTTREWILITVPYCEDLEDSQVVCPKCRCRFHKDYHLRSYHRADIESMFDAWPGVSLVRRQPISAYRMLKFSRTIRLARDARIHAGFGKQRYARNSVCPQCGWDPYATGQASDRLHTRRGSTKKATLQTFVAKHLWLKERTFRWWLALYRKT